MPRCLRVLYVSSLWTFRLGRRVLDLIHGIERRDLGVHDLHNAGKIPIYGLLEVDVTIVRKFIAEHERRTGEKLSFAGFLTYCLARAVDEDKTIQAHRKGNKHLVLFDDVNVGLMVERKVGEKTALMGDVVRLANRKTYREIHDEIRRVQSEPVPPGRGMPNWFRSALLLPWPLSRLVIALIRMNGRRDPTIAVSMGGTVALTSVGMFGGGHSGWGISPTIHPLGLVVGSISWKPVVIDGRIEQRAGTAAGSARSSTSATPSSSAAGGT